MTPTNFFSYFLSLFLAQSLNAQSPHIAGRINLDLKRGLFEADIYLSQIPQIEDPVFSINKCMNLQYMKTGGHSIGYNIDYGVAVASPYLDEGLAYSPAIDTMTDSTIFHLKYVGAFPVYSEAPEERDFADSQVKIALKSGVLRASYMSKWLPVIFDRSSKSIFSQFTYDLQFELTDTATVYLNGNPPRRIQSGRWLSNSPQHLSLFVGDYTTASYHGVWFLDSRLTLKQQEIVYQAIEQIAGVYSGWWGDSVDHHLYLAHIFSVGRPHQYTFWALAEYPLILFDLDRLQTAIDTANGRISEVRIFKIMAHELAHQTWGLKVRSNNAFWGFYSESMAEYFALKAVESYYGRNEYRQFLRKNYMSERQLKAQVKPLDQVGPDAPVNLWYSYYPVQIIGFEELAGKDALKNVFGMLRKNAHNDMNFNDLRGAATAAGIEEGIWLKFKTELVDTPNCLEKVWEMVKD